MINQYKLIGLSRPCSATLQLFHNEESFNAKYEFDESLWKYVENNWGNVDLKALVEHKGIRTGGFPIDPVVIKVLPIQF